MRTWDRVLIGVFIVVLAVPGIGLLLGLDHDDGRGEKRKLAPAPVIHADWASWRGLPDAFSRYFEDHFALRAWLVRTQADVRLKVLHSSPSPDVIAGRDGWYYFATDAGVEDYAVPSLMTAEELDAFRQMCEDTQDWLAAQGIEYLLVLTPDKTQLYPEYMPASIHRLREYSRLDQLVDYLRDHSRVHFVDVRPALREAKTRERLYHRTDTHWNARGALIGYQQIMQALRIQPMARADFDAREELVPGMDLAKMLALGGRLHEDNLTLVPKAGWKARIIEPEHPDPELNEGRLVTEVPDSRLPRLVMFRDSFGNGLIPFISEQFSRAVYLWQYEIEPKVVVQEKPNIVIHQWTGRRLFNYPPYNSIAIMRAEGKLPLMSKVTATQTHSPAAAHPIADAAGVRQ